MLFVLATAKVFCFVVDSTPFPSSENLFAPPFLHGIHHDDEKLCNYRKVDEFFYCSSRGSSFAVDKVRFGLSYASKRV
jgi:hypothetical protein